MVGEESFCAFGVVRKEEGAQLFKKLKVNGRKEANFVYEPEKYGKNYTDY